MTLSGVSFWSNYSDNVIELHGGDFNAANLTVAGNPPWGGAAIESDTEQVVVVNSIIAFNAGDATAAIAASTVSFDHVCTYANTGSDLLVGTDTNTLTDDPLFCDRLVGATGLPIYVRIADLLGLAWNAMADRLGLTRFEQLEAGQPAP